MKHRGADHLIPKATKAIHLQPTESVARRSDNNISTSWKNFEEEPEFVPRKLSDPRLGLSRKRGVADHLIPESTKAVHIQSAESIARRSDNSISTSWKNSEEEEFMWDMHSRLPDQDVANLSDNSRKDPWIPSDPEKLGFENRVRRPQVAHEVGSGFDRESSSDSLPTEQRERLSYGNRLPSPWRLQEASSGDELLFSGSTSNSSYAEANKARNGGFPSVANSLSRITAGPAGTSSQQRFPPVRAASPPQRSSLHPAPPSALLPSRYLPRQLPNAADQDCSQVLPQSHQKVHQFSRSLLPQNVVNKFQSEDLQSSPAVASAQQDRQYPMDYGLSKSFGPSQKQNPILDSNARAPSTSGSSESDQSFQHTVGTSGGSSTSSLLAAVMKSGILTNITTGGLAKKSLQDSGQVASKSSTKALPPATTQVKSFVSQSTSTPSKRPVLRDAKSCISKVAQKEKQQQLPLVSPASLQPTSKESNPISNLLSSLLVKGLIKSEASPAPSCQVAPEPEKQTTTAVNSKAALVSSLSEPVATADEKCLAKPGAKSSSNIPKSNPVILKPHTKDCVNMPQSISVKTECLIGLKFKSNLVREFHPDVIDSLFDGLPHQCNVCGFRLKDKELLDKHLEWHSETQADADVRIGTRRWYVQTEDWISPKASIPPAVDSSLANVSQSATDGDACESVMDVDDATTPADEDQCVCVLCGELFEDYYSPQRNMWMFRGAVRMKIGSGNTDASSLNGPLVHLHCRSEGSSSELGLANIVKMEE
ncbi:Polyadenylation and cleavage factor homolog 4 [Linum grandiflorum]